MQGVFFFLFFCEDNEAKIQFFSYIIALVRVVICTNLQSKEKKMFLYIKKCVVDTK